MNSATTPKPPGLDENISFRVHVDLKDSVTGIIGRSNLDASDVHRAIYYAGLNAIYGIKIEGNKPVGGNVPAPAPPEIG